ncbi:MAG: ABC transporter permease [Synergistales bacterium]|nr:ABC transporter permease [Synergistales bacterium]
MFRRIREMLRKELIQIFRDPRMRMVILVAPIIQLMVFGYAVSTDVETVRLALCDSDRTPLSRELTARFVRSGYFAVVASPRDPDDITLLLDSGKAEAALVLRSGFAAAVHAGKTAPLQLIVDGTNSNTASVVLQYARQITGDLSGELLTERLRRRGIQGRPAAFQARIRAWFNSNLESRNYYVPGVIALLVMLITLMLTSMAIVREKEIGTMEQIMVTPITQLEFILGKMLPFALIAFVDVTLISLVGVFWFHVPLRGSLLLLFLSTGCFVTTTLGIGLFLSTVSTTQQQAMMGTFLFFLPAVLLSGFMFPIANMPEPVQWVTLLNPLRHFLVILRGVFLKGVGIAVLWPQIAALALLGTSTLVLASRRFRKTLS